MVKDPRTAVRTDRLRPLATPRGTDVRTDARGLPCAVRFEGAMREVAAIQERWRIDDEWWRETPVARTYYRLQLEDGRILTLYHDLIGDRWWEQKY